MTKQTAGLLAVGGLVLASGLGASLLAAETTPRLFFLDIRGGRVLTMKPDGADVQVLVDNKKELPDGIAVDVEKGYIYWSNMGKANEDDGSVYRTNLDGSNFTTLVPKGGNFTAKQMKLDEKHGKMYWSDREGMRIQRANLDGSNIETLVVTGKGETDRADAANWCVGIAVDVDGGHADAGTGADRGGEVPRVGRRGARRHAARGSRIWCRGEVGGYDETTTPPL